MLHSHILRQVPLGLAGWADVVGAILQVALSADEQKTAELEVRAVLPVEATAGLAIGAVLHLVDKVRRHQVLIGKTEVLLETMECFLVS